MILNGLQIVCTYFKAINIKDKFAKKNHFVAEIKIT